MDKKICPLMSMSGYGAGFNPSSDNNICKEDSCAWWIGAYIGRKSHEGECAILRLAIRPLNVSLER